MVFQWFRSSFGSCGSLWLADLHSYKTHSRQGCQDAGHSDCLVLGPDLAHVGPLYGDLRRWLREYRGWRAAFLVANPAFEETLAATAPDVILLVLFNLIFFAAAYYSFIRYDVR